MSFATATTLDASNITTLNCAAMQSRRGTTGSNMRSVGRIVAANGWCLTLPHPVFINSTFYKDDILDGTGSVQRIADPTSTAAATEPSIGTAQKAVRFDPLVSVVEFVVDRRAAQNGWYSSLEMAYFQAKALEIAYKYLNEHSEQRCRYKDAFFDPITNTWRQRPLFALPILSDVDEMILLEHDHDDVNKRIESQQKDQQQPELLQLVASLAFSSTASCEDQL
jgi:hypothetical protein